MSDRKSLVMMTRGEGREGGLKWVKRVNCMVTDGNSTFGGEHNAGAIL